MNIEQHSAGSWWPSDSYFTCQRVPTQRTMSDGRQRRLESSNMQGNQKKSDLYISIISISLESPLRMSFIVLVRSTSVDLRQRNLVNAAAWGSVTVAILSCPCSENRWHSVFLLPSIFAENGLAKQNGAARWRHCAYDTFHMGNRSPRTSMRRIGR